jgi:hypothetical protein
MIFDEITGLFTVFDRLTGAWKKRKTRAITSIPSRFIELFEAHGVRRHQIPRFFGHEITLSDLADDSLLLSKLTEPVLAAACVLFGIRRSWLDGEGEEPYPQHDFYKSPSDFERFIDELKSSAPDIELNGYLIISDSALAGSRAELILKEAIGILDDNVIYRYHFCDDWVFDYWKSRAYLTACIAIAWKKGVFVKGKFARERELAVLIGKQVLPGPILQKVSALGRSWYAEDLALLPEQYLQGVDPERDKFGKISALELWLRLDEDGWMDTGLQKHVRPAFESELALYAQSDS